MANLYMTCILVQITFTFSTYLSYDDWKKSNDSSKFRMVKSHIVYSISSTHFSEVENDSRQCDINQNSNFTAMLLESADLMCASPYYIPHFLSPSQVSFKKIYDSPGDNISSIGNYSHNNTSSKPTNDSSGKIHEYLAFALLLPNHPFSQEMVDAILPIAPLFPSITIYFGYAYEFQDLCSQYGVYSFPKLLLFRNGLLTSKFERKRRPQAIAMEFSIWTNSLPIATLYRPIYQYIMHEDTKFIPKKWNNQVNAAGIFSSNTPPPWSSKSTSNNKYSKYYNKWDFRIVQSLKEIDFTRSVEPFASVSKRASLYEMAAYALCIVYLSMRMIYIVWTYLY